MAKAKVKQETPKADNTQMLSLSAEVAIDKLFIDLRNPSLDDIAVFSADICLRTAAILKNNMAGETDKDKTLAALAMINNICVNTVTSNEAQK